MNHSLVITNVAIFCITAQLFENKNIQTQEGYKTGNRDMGAACGGGGSQESTTPWIF
jgi:hypothetical protein